MSNVTPLKDDEKIWAMLSHLLAMVGGMASGHCLGFLAPLIILLTKGKENAFVQDQARESLNFQITLLIVGLIVGAVSLLVALVTCGVGFVILLPVLFLSSLVVWGLMIYASIQAYNGISYRYPVNFRLVK